MYILVLSQLSQVEECRRPHPDTQLVNGVLVIIVVKNIHSVGSLDVLQFETVK